MLLFLGVGYLAHGGSSTWSVVVVVMDFGVSSILCHVTRNCTAHDDLRSTSPTSPLSDLTGTWASFNHIMQHSDFSSGKFTKIRPAF